MVDMVMLILELTQTQHVLSKAQASKTPATKVSSKGLSHLAESSEDYDTEFDFNALTSTDGSALIATVSPAAYSSYPPRAMAISIEDQGSTFFFHHFVIAGNTSPSSYTDFLPLMYNSESVLGSAPNPLPGVIKAIGMAGITNMQSSPAPTAMAATRQKHISVLRALNVALQDPRTAGADSTLMAVMLLGLFEVRALSKHPIRNKQS